MGQARRDTAHPVRMGEVQIGEGAPVVVQSMTNTDTADAAGTASQVAALMGCIVNGPGESKSANLGISLPGTGESPRCPVFVDGRQLTTLEESADQLAARFLALLDEVVATRCGGAQPERG